MIFVRLVFKATVNFRIKKVEQLLLLFMNSVKNLVPFTVKKKNALKLETYNY